MRSGELFGLRRGPASGPRRYSLSVLTYGALIAALWSGCSPESAPSQTSANSSVRVVSLSPIASEVLLSLGAIDALIAIDSQSRDLNGLEALPVVDLAGSLALAPDLVVVPPLRATQEPVAERLRAAGSEVLEFAPDDFDEAYSLVTRLGRRLERVQQAHAYVRDHSRELAVMSSEALGHQRPRVAAVIGLSPLEVAGGHSFLTDLIEVAGAESVTHGNHDLEIPMSAVEILATAPDLIVVISSLPMSEVERSQATLILGAGPKIAFMVFDHRHFWLRSATQRAREMRDLIQPLVGGRLQGVVPARDLSGLAEAGPRLSAGEERGPDQ